VIQVPNFSELGFAWFRYARLRVFLAPLRVFSATLRVFLAPLRYLLGISRGREARRKGL